MAEQVDHVCWGNDVELMNKAACRRYGLTRADAQVVARKYRGRWYVSAESLDGWVVAGAVEPVRPDPGYVIPGVVNGRKAAA